MKQPAILLLSIGLVIGVALSSWLPWITVAMILVVAAFVAIWKLGIRATLLIGLAASLGVWRVAAAPLSAPPGDIYEVAKRTVKGTGVVLGFPQYTNGRQQAVVKLEARGYSGKTLVTLEPYPALSPGDVVSFEGSLKEPKAFEGFDYQKYLAKDGIYTVAYNPKLKITGHQSTLDRIIYPVRQAFLERLGRLYQEPVAGFLSAILIGERSGLPDSLQSAFRKTGTVHVMALSGYNISILIAAVIAILGRSLSVIWISFFIIFAFVILVGPSPSVVRAALMGSFLLLGQIFGRPQLAMLACMVTAAAMLANNPWSLRYDLGFDLSFLATLGILAWEEPVRNLLTWLPEGIKEIVSATVSASLPTTPLIALTFGTVSLISPVANVLVVPAIPWLMLGAFVSAVVGLVVMPLASVIALFVQFVTEFILGTVDFLANIPGGSITLPGIWPSVISVLGLLMCLAMLLPRRRHA
ncbi:ComEC family competence protein [Patescibacteria group bacterium]|nr:ComEC family competence protein [Patescibacteria group bacterium]